MPWSTYSVFLTTLTHWALPYDLALLYFCPQNAVVWALLLCLMLTSKFIKLLGHFIRYPVDFVFLPLSILFGYFHGLIIKPYAMITLDVVSISVQISAVCI